MALNTQTGTKLGQQIVTDVRPTDINADKAVMPSTPQRISPELAILFDKSIVARPLGTPQVGDIKIKNLEYQYRWCNRHAKGGLMYQMRRAQGWTNATTDDAEVLSGDATVTNGEITAFDVILMKIPKERYAEAMKFNMEKAMALTRARGIYLDGASSDVMSDKTPVRQTVAQEPYNRRGDLAKPFIPDNADAIIDDSVRTGRVEATRATVEKLRANGSQKE